MALRIYRIFSHMIGYTSFLDEASFVVGCAVGGCTGFAVADFGVRVAKMFSGTLAGAVVRITLRRAGLGCLVPDIAVFAAGLVIFLGAVFIFADIMRRTTVQVAEIGAGLATAVCRGVAAPTDFRAVFRPGVGAFHKAVAGVYLVLIFRPVAGIAGFPDFVVAAGNIAFKDISGTGVAFAFFI